MNVSFPLPVVIIYHMFYIVIPIVYFILLWYFHKYVLLYVTAFYFWLTCIRTLSNCLQPQEQTLGNLGSWELEQDQQEEETGKPRSQQQGPPASPPRHPTWLPTCRCARHRCICTPVSSSSSTMEDAVAFLLLLLCPHVVAMAAEEQVLAIDAYWLVFIKHMPCARLINHFSYSLI